MKPPRATTSNPAGPRPLTDRQRRASPTPSISRGITLASVSRRLSASGANSLNSPGGRRKHPPHYQPAGPSNVGCRVGADERCWQHDQHAAHESPPGCRRMFSQRPTPHLPPPTWTTAARRPGRRLSAPCRRNSETGRANAHFRTACPPSLATRGGARRLNLSGGESVTDAVELSLDRCGRSSG